MFIVTAVNPVNHPFHVHGYQLFVTSMGQHPDKIPMTVQLAREMLSFKPALFSMTSTNFPLKDTVSIPSKGYTILRFKADNPGFWLLHCHFGELRDKKKFY